MPASPALPRLYGIVNCDTVKKARAWFQQQGRDMRFHDFKKVGVPVDRLDAWIGAVGWERLVNRAGTTWRKLDERAARWCRRRGECEATDAGAPQRDQAAGRRVAER